MLNTKSIAKGCCDGETQFIRPHEAQVWFTVGTHVNQLMLQEDLKETKMEPNGRIRKSLRNQKGRHHGRTGAWHRELESSVVGASDPKPDAILTQVRFPGAARELSPRANFRCRLSFDVRTTPSVQSNASKPVRTSQESQTLAAIQLFGHTNILHTPVGLGISLLLPRL